LKSVSSNERLEEDSAAASDLKQDGGAWPPEFSRNGVLLKEFRTKVNEKGHAYRY